MESQYSKIYPQKWAQIILLLGFCFGLYFLGLCRWDLWNPDEPRYAQVTREMVDRGDWVLLHVNGKIYGDKPPLFFWLIALSSYLFGGFHSLSARFPSAFFGTLTVLLTFFLGKTLYRSRTGFLSGLVLATSAEFAYLSNRVNIDATLTFFTTASLLCFIEWLRYRREESGEAKVLKVPTIYGFYVGMGLATLAKGPVGFILPLLVSASYLAVQKDWKTLKEMKLLPGVLLFLLIVLSWYIPAVRSGGKAYMQETLFKHTVDAYVEGWTHVKPIYYYFLNFPLGFFPWIFFLPAAIAYGLSRETRLQRGAFVLLLTWFAVIFVFFTLSKGKRAIYLLPLYPAASLMVGKLWDDLLSTSTEHLRREWISLPVYGLAGLLLLAGATAPWMVSTYFPSYVLYSLPLAFLLIGGSLAVFVFFRFKNHGAIFLVVVAVVGVGFLYVTRVIFPLINPYKSARFMSEEIMARVQPGEKLAVYGGSGPSPYNFFTGRVPIIDLERRSQLFDFLRSEDRVYCLLTDQALVRLQTRAEWPPGIRIHARRRIGDGDIVLISNR